MKPITFRIVRLFSLSCSVNIQQRHSAGFPSRFTFSISSQFRMIPFLMGRFRARTPLMCWASCPMYVSLSRLPFIISCKRENRRSEKSRLEKIKKKYVKLKCPHLIFWQPDDGWEYNVWEVLICKSGFHQTRPGIQDYGGLEIRHLQSH